MFIGLTPNSAFLGPALERESRVPRHEPDYGDVDGRRLRRRRCALGSTKQLGSAVGDGITALLMTRRYLESHHHKAVPLVDA